MPLKENWRLFGGSPLTPLIDWTYGPERRGLYRRNDIKMSGRQVPLLRNNFSTDPETKTIRGSFIFESFGGSFEVALYLGAEVFYIRPGTEVMTAYSAKVGRRLGLSGPEQYFALQEIKLNKEKNNTESIIISELTSGVNFVSKSSLGPNNFSFRSTNKGSVCALFNGVELCADGKKINEKGTVGFSFTESARFRNEDDPKIRFEEVFGYSE